MGEENVNPRREFLLWHAGAVLAAASACADVWVLLLVSGVVHGADLHFRPIHAAGVAGTSFLVWGLVSGRKYFRDRSQRTAIFPAALFLLGAALSLLRMGQGIS